MTSALSHTLHTRLTRTRKHIHTHLNKSKNKGTHQSSLFAALQDRQRQRVSGDNRNTVTDKAAHSGAVEPGSSAQIPGMGVGSSALTNHMPGDDVISLTHTHTRSYTQTHIRMDS